MRVALTAQPQRLVSGKPRRCPVPAFANATIMRAATARRHPHLAVCPERAAFNTPLRKRVPGQPFSPESHVNQELPSLAPPPKPPTVVGACGRVGAETATPNSGFRPHRRSVQHFSTAPSHLLVARTTEPQRLVSGKIGPCPLPALATATLLRSASVRSHWLLVILRGKQHSTPLFGSELRVNHLVRNHTSTKRCRAWRHLRSHLPLSVRAVASVPRRQHRTPVSGLTAAACNISLRPHRICSSLAPPSRNAL